MKDYSPSTGLLKKFQNGRQRKKSENPELIKALQIIISLLSKNIIEWSLPSILIQLKTMKLIRKKLKRIWPPTFRNKSKYAPNFLRGDTLVEMKMLHILTNVITNLIRKLRVLTINIHKKQKTVWKEVPLYESRSGDILFLSIKTTFQ